MPIIYKNSISIKWLSELMNEWDKKLSGYQAFKSKPSWWEILLSSALSLFFPLLALCPHFILSIWCNFTYAFERGAGEDSWEFLRLQGDQTSQS